MKAIEKTKSLIVILFISILGITSCHTTYNMSSIQVEIMRPALIELPAEDTIAIFNRYFYQTDSTYSYLNGDSHKVFNDTTFHYSTLSNKCVDALANSLKEEGYFLKVINYSDSMNYLFSPNGLINYPELHKSLGADVLVFLNYFKFNDRFAESKIGFNDFMSSIKDEFEEFHNSTKVERIEASLLWSISVRSDTSLYVYKQHPNNLCYGNSVYPRFFGNNENHKLLLINTAEYLGKSFAMKISPSWQEVNRRYYRSHNDQMLIAEKFFLDNDWLKAAEAYKRVTMNKNPNIAAKAKYNMALVCEMEGNLDAAIDWLDRSKSAFKHEDQFHKSNCNQYSILLESRKKEIERLEKQIRNHEEI